jgi:AraC-like DNA-binding protein
MRHFDILSDILGHIKLTSSLYFKTDFSAPWGMDIPEGPFAQFHIVVNGNCLFKMGNRTRSLHTGDILMFPNGTAHWLADATDSQRCSGPEIVRSVAHGNSFAREGGETTTLICGHFDWDRQLNHLYLNELPDIMYLSRGCIDSLAWLQKVTALLVDEMDVGMEGQQLIVNRLGEILFIHILRAHLVQHKADHGFVAGLRDKRIRAALEYMHNHMERSHSLDTLANKAGMSRTSFFNLFKTTMDRTPKQYSVDIKINRSKELLQRTDKKIAEICQMVGYDSESSFNKSFKKSTAMTPMAYRNQNRDQRM